MRLQNHYRTNKLKLCISEFLKVRSIVIDIEQSIPQRNNVILLDATHILWDREQFFKESVYICKGNFTVIPVTQTPHTDYPCSFRQGKSVFCFFKFSLDIAFMYATPCSSGFTSRPDSKILLHTTRIGVSITLIAPLPS